MDRDQAYEMTLVLKKLVKTLEQTNIILMKSGGIRE